MLKLEDILVRTFIIISFDLKSRSWRLLGNAFDPRPACEWFVIETVVDCILNVMAHAQKPDFVFRRNGRVHLNRRGRQFSRLLAAEVSASAVVMLDAPCCEVVWRVLATHSIRQIPLHFPSRASPCAITFQLDSTRTGSFLSTSVQPGQLSFQHCSLFIFIYLPLTLCRLESN